MFCTKCGTQIPDGSKFCYKCGAPIPAEQKDSVTQDYFDTPPASYTAPEQQPVQPAQPESQGVDEGTYGLAGFILSFIFPLLGLIFSIMGMSRKKYHGFAVAGFIISLVSMVMYVVIIIVVASLASSAPSGGYYYYYYACSFLS